MAGGDLGLHGRAPEAVTRAQALLLATLCAGCGGSPAMGMDAGVDAAPALDPRLFDCTSLGADGMHLPERASAIPAACALDPACRTPQISGHRGVGGMTGNLGKIAPEDTLAAYRAAIALGIEFVETDPRPTADGVLVNMHDDSVERTTDGTGSVSQLSFATIRALHINPQGVPGDYACEKVPTLTEILKTCRGRVVVLIDANKTDRVDLLVQAVREADALDWAVFDTSSVDKIDQALKIVPKLRFMNRPASIAEITAQFDH
ncbi:MAG: glycerophosphodiester phosphodiesterase family protein, partial [Myxococcales bacterium]|nr:glycerophosphodiester phosphodiesterase family protein [Myxococcales bacterium]